MTMESRIMTESIESGAWLLDTVSRSILTIWEEGGDATPAGDIEEIIDELITVARDIDPDTAEQIQEVGGDEEVRRHMAYLMRREHNIS